MEQKIKKISDWINEQGYPLEMYCEKILSTYQFSVIQSLHYEDEQSKKFREIDILATKYKVVNGVTFNFSIVLECKLSKDKPWLLFARKPHKEFAEEIIKDVFTTKNGKQLISRSKDLNELSLLSYNHEKVGFNLTQCFTTGKDIPYQAIMSTISACEYLVAKSNDSARKFCNFYFPVIVIDSELYECRNNETNEMDINNIEVGKLLSVRSYSERSSILHTIVTKQGFDNFIQELSQELEKLLDKILPDLQYISENRPSNKNPDYSFI